MSVIHNVPYVAPLVIPPSILNELDQSATPVKRSFIDAAREYNDWNTVGQSLNVQPYTPYTPRPLPRHTTFTPTFNTNLPKHVSFNPVNQYYPIHQTYVASMVDDLTYPPTIHNVRARNRT